MSTKQVVARLTVIRRNGRRTIVEVEANASFHSFYNFYQQDGSRRSTKRWVRTASRNEGLNVVNAHLHQPGLDVIAERLASYQSQSNPVVSTKVRIIKKRAYRRLITVSADVIGLSKLTTTDLNGKRLIPVTIPTFRIVSKVNHSKLHRGLVSAR